MRTIRSFDALEKLGRVRLSRHFFMREFLYSEISNYYGIPNVPDDPDLAIQAGSALCRNLLDPLFETFGNVSVRSAYRAPAVNALGNEKGHSCARNEKNYAGHIWDKRDSAGRMGACATITIPWFADRYDKGRDWRDLAWWIHDHLPYSAMQFFPVRAAFNLTWREEPERLITSYIAPRGLLLRAGETPEISLQTRAAFYRDFPPLRDPPPDDAGLGPGWGPSAGSGSRVRQRH